MSPVNNQLPPLTSLAGSIPPGRIRHFLRVAGHDPVRAHALHEWNEKLGAALFRPLQKLELALRARVGGAFERVFGPDWYRDPGFQAIAAAADRNTIATAVQRLMKEAAPIDGEAVLAKASFGLCVGLLRPTYNPPVWSRELHRTFPGLPTTESRYSFAKLASEAAWLRNRIDHHEPLVELDLSLLHSNILQALGWIDSTVAALARGDSKVQELLRAKP